MLLFLKCNFSIGLKIFVQSVLHQRKAVSLSGLKKKQAGHNY
jgi:hypothetical protein